MYGKVWHGFEPYNKKEKVRLELACRAIAAHRQSLNLSRRYKLLDIGCGVGPLREWLEKDKFHITGLEFGESAAKIAEQNYDACEIGDVESEWPFESASLDGLHAGAVLEHVIDWHAPLNHAGKCLRDNGLLVISVPNLRHWREIHKLILGKQPHWIRCMEHLHGYTPKFLRKLVSLHGFEVKTITTDSLELPFMPDCLARRFLAGFGSVIILAARLKHRVQIEDSSKAWQFPNHKRLGKHYIEIPEE